MARSIDNFLSALQVGMGTITVCHIARNERIFRPAVDQIEIRYVLEGTLFVEASDGAEQAFGAGHVILFPAATSRRMGGQASRTRPPLTAWSSSA